MAHELEAVVARFDLLDKLARDRRIPVVALKQGFGLIPLTKDVIKSLAGELTSADSGDVRRGRDLYALFQRWSIEGPIVYVANEIHAGVGPQTALIWEDGRLAFSQEGQPGSGPISMALLRLGASGGRLGYDEFDVVGLGRHRSTDGWLTNLRIGFTPPPSRTKM